LQLSPDATPSIEIERVGSGLQFVDGLAWARGGFLVAADVRQNKLYRFEGPGRPKVLKENDGGVSGLAYDLQGRLYLCESVSRRVSRMDRQGAVEEVAAGYQGKKFNSPNDIVVRRDYQVFFTDPAFGSAADKRELDFYGIYHVAPKGDIDLVARWQTRPNGIALSMDGKLLYVADSDRHAVVAFDVGRNGETSNQRDVITRISGVPGGIKTDVEGRVYVAAKGVSIYSQAGKFERTILETENVANCAFGEADSEHFFMSARSAIFRAHIGVKGAFQY
jgi:gluconolactonase